MKIEMKLEWFTVENKAQPHISISLDGTQEELKELSNSGIGKSTSQLIMFIIQLCQ